MTLTAHKIWHLSLLLLAFWLGGCAMQYSEEDILPDPMLPGSDLSLVLNIHTGDPINGMTRAEEYSVEYENPMFTTERMKSLRVIIVENRTGEDVQNKIIHNYSEVFMSELNEREGLQFKIEYDCPYKVYLIANEFGLPVDLKNEIAMLRPETVYEAGKLEGKIISAEAAGMPIIDNTPDGIMMPIPMTEIYDIDPVQLSETRAVKNIVEEEMFVTRAASKFSFYFFKGNDLTDIGADVEDWEIKKVKITGLGDKQYLFPFNTVYVPTKEADRSETDRDITGFDLPGDSRIGNYVFSLPIQSKSFKLSDLPTRPSNFNAGNPSAGVSYIPQLYFPESKGEYITDKPFTCTISYDGEEYLTPVKLPNLPNGLPRNSHVVIIITVYPHSIEAEVVHYDSKDIEIDFGEIDNPKPLDP